MLWFKCTIYKIVFINYYLYTIELFIMLFHDIIGQEGIKNQLLRMVAEERVAHAIMFAGDPGFGGFPMAYAFARFLNCTNRGADDACGVCPSCVKYNKLVHPDQHFVYPVVKKDSSSKMVCDDVIDKWREFVLESPYFTMNEWFNVLDSEKQGIIYSAETQEIYRKLSLKTYEGKYKIMLIWLPEKMNQEGANKILKILEEPPASTVFMLVSEKPAELLPTILSRVQTIKMPAIDKNTLANRLQSEFGVDSTLAQKVAHFANGSYIKARNGIEQDANNQENLEMFKSMMRICYSRKMPDILAFVDKAAVMGRDSLKNMLVYSIDMVRENFIHNQKDQSLNYMMPGEEEFAVRFAPFIHENNVFEINNELEQAIQHVTRNGNIRIIIMDLMLKLTMLILRPKPQHI